MALLATRLFCLLTGSLVVLYGQQLDVMLTIETSSGTEQAIGLLRPRAFQKGERAGVIGLSSRTTQVLQPLTEDRDALASAIQRAGIRVGVALGGVQLDTNWTINLAAAIGQACEELQQSKSSDRRRAVIVLFGSEDPGLRAHLESARASLSAVNARLYAVVIDRSTNQRANPLGTQVRVPHPFPVLTAQLMSELAAQSGGRIFRGAWDLKEILKEARKP
jgi:hypothetical protein